jgi:hypothetical protein
MQDGRLLYFGTNHGVPGLKSPSKFTELSGKMNTLEQDFFCYYRTIKRRPTSGEVLEKTISASGQVASQIFMINKIYRRIQQGYILNIKLIGDNLNKNAI